MILSQEEADIKSKLWFAENGDFLKEQESEYTHTHTVQLLTDLYCSSSKETKGTRGKG